MQQQIDPADAAKRVGKAVGHWGRARIKDVLGQGTVAVDLDDEEAQAALNLARVAQDVLSERRRPHGVGLTTKEAEVLQKFDDVCNLFRLRREVREAERRLR